MSNIMVILCYFACCHVDLVVCSHGGGALVHCGSHDKVARSGRAEVTIRWVIFGVDAIYCYPYVGFYIFLFSIEVLISQFFAFYISYILSY